MARNSILTEYIDTGVQIAIVPNPATFRSNLYAYARRNGLDAKAYVEGSTVVFAISRDEVVSLPGQPQRGAPTAERTPNDAKISLFQ